MSLDRPLSDENLFKLIDEEDAAAPLAYDGENEDNEFDVGAQAYTAACIIFRLPSILSFSICFNLIKLASFST